MAGKKRGLGRGLDALLGVEPGAVITATDESQGGELRTLPVDWLERGPYQPRRHFDEDALQELADSIRAQGVVQPIVVRPAGEQRYEIVAGERRWRAAQLAGMEEIPALVREIADEAAIAVGLIENLQRQDLNPLEAASALKRLIDDFGLSHQAAAEAVGRSRTAVTNLLRLLDLNEDVQRLIDEGHLDAGHAKALAGLSGGLQSEAAARVASKGLSVRETELLIRRLQGEAEEAARAGSADQHQRAEDPDLERLQEDLAQRLGAAVAIQHSRRRGKGSLVIRYNSLEELDGILGRIR